MKKKLVLAVVLGLVLAGGTASAGMLWEIGVADNSAAEFALAPGDYAQFSEDGLFVVGKSDERRDWPYVQPGPSDTWAGGRSHTFSVVFALGAAPTEGECTLHVDLVDTHSGGPPVLTVAVNGREFSQATPAGAGDQSVRGDFAQGREFRFDVGFPADLLKAGMNEVAIASASGSWCVYDWLGLDAPDAVQLAEGTLPKVLVGEVNCPPLLYERHGALFQPVRVSLRGFGAPSEAVVRVTGAEPVTLQLAAGRQTVEIGVPAVEAETPATLTVEADGAVVSETPLTLKPVRKWVVYLLHHTHLDIGYTHVQTEVEAIQWRHLEQAEELARETATYPPGAQYKWLPEGLWAVDGYLRNASVEKREAFLDAVRRGWIGLDALYGNELTALCRPEELLELTWCARDLAKRYRLPIDSAMISDVPGYTWGLIPTLALSGVKYLSIGPNEGHRIGYTLSEWGDKPFYWVSPSGKDKVLCWVHAKAYSMFHHQANRVQIHAGSDGRVFLDYLSQLEDNGFPYDLLAIRYNIGGDNGPPDPELPRFVRDWNTRYAYPKFVIATTSEAFGAFEARYGSSLPEVRGDFTPYWEDGAGSSALETGINREAAERLVQAQTLWSMLDPRRYPAADFHAAWREVLLYDEHTWGAHNSISQPESDFAQQQWKIKQAFATSGEAQSRRLLSRALESRRAPSHDVKALLVFNICSWTRTDLVVCPKAWGLVGDLVKGPDGQPVPSQRRPDGSLVFVARDVPPVGAAKYTVEPGEAVAVGAAAAKRNKLSNERLTVTVDPDTGAIASLACDGISQDLVDRANGLGLNDYFYVAGRDPKTAERNGKAEIAVTQDGPLEAALVITSDAPGCKRLAREIRVVAGLDRVDVVDTLDKELVYTKEAVHIAFPFNVPDGVVRMDLPWAVARPETDQLPGACKNYFTVQRWVDVSNTDYGVTWATLDAPLVEVGAITADPTVVGWIKDLAPSTTLYSYAMNNYWETNYKAGQDGPTPFRFSLRPHGVYSQAEAQQFGIECGQPLVAIPAREDAAAPSSLLRVAPAGVVVTSVTPSEDGRALMVRLFNGTDQAADATVFWGDPAPKSVSVSGLDERPGVAVPASMAMAPYEIVTLRAEMW